MIRQCDTGGICPHTPQCDHFCHFTNAELEPETRKVKPYPAVPADIDPVPQAWQIIGSVLVGFVLVALVVIAALFFFTGFYIWTLLI
jgi:hypothetical protein